MAEPLACESQTILAKFPARGQGRALTVADAERAAVDDALHSAAELVTWVHEKFATVRCAPPCRKYLEWDHPWTFTRLGKLMDREYVDVVIEFTATVRCRKHGQG